MSFLPSDVLYKSLGQVLRALNSKKDIPEVRSILKLCIDSGLVKDLSSVGDEAANNHAEEFSGSTIPRYSKYPFIVIEGMDGTGKTTLARFLSERLQMKLLNTPPKNNPAFIKDRDYFDNQDEPFRRAWYSLGNYLAQVEVLKSKQPVVMDRFWHSTAAYSLAHLRKFGGPFPEFPLTWPADLIQPSLVIFLRVSEKERLRRHATRKNFTNTAEEQILADDEMYRQNLVEYYRKVEGPPFHELIVDGEQDESEKKILDFVLSKFPEVESQISAS